MFFDIYKYIISYLPIYDRPIISRDFITSYIHRRIHNFHMIPLLVDIIWHAPIFCSPFCVCKVASKQDRIDYYIKRNKFVYDPKFLITI